MKVAKWGNSLALRLPVTVVKALGLKEGDEIEIHFAGAREFGIARKPSREDFLNQLRAYRGRLPRDFKFDRQQAHARQSVSCERPMTRLIEAPSEIHCIKRACRRAS
jgi:antitoxin MazE